MNSVFFAADKPVPPRTDVPDGALVPVTANHLGMMGIAQGATVHVRRQLEINDVNNDLNNSNELWELG